MEWQIGKFRIQLVIQDWFWLWGEILWSGIPMEKWTEWGWHQNPYQLGEKNKIRNAINCFLITSPEGSHILVDTSIGKPNQWEKSTMQDFLLENGFDLTANHRDFPHPFIVTEESFALPYKVGYYTKTLDVALYKPNISLLIRRLEEKTQENQKG